MTTTAELAVVPRDGWFVVDCSIHGTNDFVIFRDELSAGMAALGHAAAHHRGVPDAAGA